jgi:hypothetical protein
LLGFLARFIFFALVCVWTRQVKRHTGPFTTCASMPTTSSWTGQQGSATEGDIRGFDADVIESRPLVFSDPDEKSSSAVVFASCRQGRLDYKISSDNSDRSTYQGGLRKHEMT